MHPIIQKALSNIKNANISGYFEEMDKISMPSSFHKATYAQHKGVFTTGKAPWDFYQQLEIFAKQVNEAVEGNRLKKEENNNSTPKDDRQYLLDRRLDKHFFGFVALLVFLSLGSLGILWLVYKYNCPMVQDAKYLLGVIVFFVVVLALISTSKATAEYNDANFKIKLYGSFVCFSILLLSFVFVIPKPNCITDCLVKGVAYLDGKLTKLDFTLVGENNAEYSITSAKNGYFEKTVPCEEVEAIIGFNYQDSIYKIDTEMVASDNIVLYFVSKKIDEGNIDNKPTPHDENKKERPKKEITTIKENSTNLPLPKLRELNIQGKITNNGEGVSHLTLFLIKETDTLEVKSDKKGNFTKPFFYSENFIDLGVYVKEGDALLLLYTARRFENSKTTTIKYEK